MSYLLGDLPDEEMERLDELSVTDEPFAQRLREAEHDLVDRYVRGELAGTLRQRVDRLYASSDRGRSRLRFAEALEALTRRGARSMPAPRRDAAVRRTMRWSQLPVAATVILAVASAVLFTSNARLRRDVQDLESQRDALTAAADRQRQQASQTPVPPPPPSTPVTAFVRAPRRDAGGVPSIQVPRAADRVVINLELESNDFVSYYAALIVPTGGQVLWRSGDLGSTAGADGPVVAVALPASILGTGRYALELHGRSRDGADDPLASYPFDIVIK